MRLSLPPLPPSRALSVSMNVCVYVIVCLYLFISFFFWRPAPAKVAVEVADQKYESIQLFYISPSVSLIIIVTVVVNCLRGVIFSSITPIWEWSPELLGFEKFYTTTSA